jgi:hypothetical protein
MMVAGGLMFIAAAYAHDVALARTPEEAEQFEFYATWLQPEEDPSKPRVKSCCDKVDCSPIVEWKQRGDGAWMIKTEMSLMYNTNAWYPVPNWVWEDHQPDPRASPNSKDHACIMHGVVVCAIRAPLT